MAGPWERYQAAPAQGPWAKYQAQAPRYADPDGGYSPTEGMGTGERLAVGAGRGALDVFQGIKQLGLEGAAALGLIDPQKWRDYTAAKTEEAALYDRGLGKEGGAATVGRVAGNIAALPVPAVGAGGIAARLGGAALTGAAQAGAQFVPTGGNRSENALQGAVLGAVGQGVIGEPLRALAGRSAALAGAGDDGLTAQARTALQYAKERALPLHYDDLSRNSFARAAGTAADDLPIIGTGGTRATQAKAAEAEARKVVQSFSTGSGKRIGDALKDSAEAQLNRARGIKNQLYRSAFDALNKAGDFDAPQARQYALAAIKAEQARGTLADGKLIGELQKYADAPNFNFEGWHTARADLGGTIRAGMTGDSAVLGDRATAVLRGLKGRVDDDLSKAANGVGGNASKLWRQADNFYRQQMPKYKRGVVADLLRSKNPDAIAERILGGSDREGIAREVYRSLDKGGRAEVRASLLQKALDNSLSPDRPFSPAAFAGELDKMTARTGVFFSPAEKRTLDGLQNYMSHVKRAGQYLENPPTGKRLLPYAIGAAGIAEPSSLVGITGGAQALKVLFRTAKGRDLLLRLGSVSPQSRQAEQLAQQVNSYITRAAPAAAGNPQPQPRR